jgi:two-component system KDP operon response regulator KdpE
MRILIVDDERQITRVLRTSLQSSGYDVSVANNGLEAFEMFQHRQSPDLIITDLAMPEMNGIELTRAVRRISEIPILVLSVSGAGDHEGGSARRRRRRLCDQAVFSMPELLARVRANLRKSCPP